MNTPPLGLVGLGLLGTALAERFLKAGHPVVGYDLADERTAALAALGGRPAASARDVARACDRLVLSLPDTPAVDAVLAGLAADLRPGLWVVDTTTGDPEATARRGEALARRGVTYLDATVAGTSEQVRSSDAVVLVGGEPHAAATCADLFACFAREWFHVGPWGSGARMKLVVNLVLGLNRAVLAEGLGLARACGLDPALALEVLRAGPAYARVMDTKGPKMLAQDFRPQARLSQHLKDVRLILAEAQRTGARVPLSAVHRQLLEEVEAAGHGGDDNAAIVRAYLPGPGP